MFVTLALSLAASLAAFTVLWLVSLRINDVSVVDSYWATGFAVIAWLNLWREGSAAPLQLVFAVLVSLWALRMTVYLVKRHRRSGGEDPRYRALRESGGPNFRRDSLFTIFWLQALLQWLIAAPVHAATLMPVAPQPALALFGLGIALFALGLATETFADAAIARFRATPGNAGKLLTDGIFAWSRHPNYFGESLAWLGLALASYALSGRLIGFAGWLLLTLLLVKVSGVPILEKLWEGRPGYAEWAARTSPFLPWPPRTRVTTRRATR
jgi:steroid 5-alpha reductase family enzyme